MRGVEKQILKNAEKISFFLSWEVGEDVFLLGIVGHHHWHIGSLKTQSLPKGAGAEAFEVAAQHYKVRFAG